MPPLAPVNTAGRLSTADPAQVANRAEGFAREASEGIYSAQQALAGKAVYERACVACHGVDFQPAPGSPSLKGGAFMANWRGRSVAELFAYTRGNMPVGMGGSLPDSDYLALTAFMLEINGFPAGEPLDPDEAMLSALGIE